MPTSVPAEAAKRHAELSPSTYPQVEVCPSYLGNGLTSAAAEEGNMLHGLIEAHKAGLLESADFRALEDDRHRDMLEACMEYVAPFLQGADRCHWEAELDLSCLGIVETGFGTPDLIAEFGERRHVDLFDWKFGWMAVQDAEINLQAWIYTMGIFLGSLPFSASVDTVTVHIVAPRRMEVSTHTFGRADVPSMLLRAQTVARERREKAGKVFNAVAENCLWCDNKANCPALHMVILRSQPLLPVSVPSFIPLLDETFRESPDSWDAAAEVCNFIFLFEKWCKDWRKKLLPHFTNDVDIPGFRLARRRGKIDFPLTGEAVKVIFASYGLDLHDPGQLYTLASLSYRKLEAAIAAGAPKGGKAKEKAELRRILQEAELVTFGKSTVYLKKTTKPNELE